jgi:hypothetical protein
MIKYALPFFLLATTVLSAEDLPTQAPANDCEAACSKDSSTNNSALEACMEACKGTTIETPVTTNSAGDVDQGGVSTEGKSSVDNDDTTPRARS